MKKTLTALLLCLAFTSNATTYYISTTGNDATGTGTLNNPWKTLYKATSTVNTVGDIIHVVAGVYTETQTCNLSVGVSIEGDGVTSVIKSSMDQSSTPEAAFDQPVVFAASAMGTNGNQHISYLKFDGGNINGWAIYIRGRSNFSIHHCTVIEYIDRGVIFDGRNDNSGLEPTTYARGNSFYDNTVNNCAIFSGYGRGCLNIGGQEGMLIYNNTITQNSRPSGQNGWPIKYWNEGWTRGCKIYNNTITKIPYKNDGWDFCLEMFNNSGLEIYSNTFQGSLDFNYQKKGTYPYCIYIHDNVISQPAPNPNIESGVIVEYSIDGLIVENNKFNNLTKNVVLYPRTGDSIKNVVVQKNLFTNINGASGSAYGGYESGTGESFQENITIQNNTFTATPTNAPNFAINLGTTASGYTVKNVQCKNNIIQGFVTNACRSGNLGVVSNSTFSHNNLYLNGDNTTLFPSWASPSGLPTSTTISNNLNLNPLFVSAADFNLQSGSPCVDAGIDVGLPFNGSAPDIGYYEYAVVNSTVTNLADELIVIYPNPSTNKITVNLNNKQATSMEVYDALGKLVLTQKIASNETTLSLTELPNGIYTLKVNLDNGVVAQKIIKE
jgi:Secretion system C-terminal sorting domain